MRRERERGRQTSRRLSRGNRAALILAAALHGILLVVVETIPKRERPAAAFAGGEAKSTEIEVGLQTEKEEAPPADARVEESQSGRARRSSRETSVPSAKVVAGRGEAVAEVMATNSPPPVTTEPVGRSDGPPPGFRVAPVGLLAHSVESNPFLTAPRADGDEKNAGPGDKDAVRTIRSELRNRDRRLGLGASGPVIAQVEEIARMGASAIESHASFDVVANGEGEIVSVVVSDASEDRAGWQEVAKALLASLRAKHVRVRVPRSARGLAMTIAIDSREALPSGAAPGVNVRVFDQKIASGKNERSSAVTILPLARLPVTLPAAGKPGATQTVTLVLPVPVPIIAGAFDVTDIGAHATRQVHARATSEQEL